MHRSPAEAAALIERYFDREAPESKSLQNDLDRVFDDPKVREHFGELIAEAVWDQGMEISYCHGKRTSRKLKILSIRTWNFIQPYTN
jgi:hypothetical protein